jgi:hypothetical protein
MTGAIAPDERRKCILQTFDAVEKSPFKDCIPGGGHVVLQFISFPVAFIRR